MAADPASVPEAEDAVESVQQHEIRKTECKQHSILQVILGYLMIIIITIIIIISLLPVSFPDSKAL